MGSFEEFCLTSFFSLAVQARTCANGIKLYILSYGCCKKGIKYFLYLFFGNKSLL